MTKEQFDMKYCGEKVAVNCDTEEKAKALLKLAKSFGYRLPSGNDLEKISYWKDNKDNTCYRFYDTFVVIFSKKDYETYYTIVEFELDEPKETFKVGDVVYISSYGQDSQTYTIVGFENMAIIKNNRGGQKLEELSNLTHKKPLKKITKEQLADMGYEVKE